MHLSKREKNNSTWKKVLPKQTIITTKFDPKYGSSYETSRRNSKLALDPYKAKSTDDQQTEQHKTLTNMTSTEHPIAQDPDLGQLLFGNREQRKQPILPDSTITPDLQS